jgi:hypothetical protein
VVNGMVQALPFIVVQHNQMPVGQVLVADMTKAIVRNYKPFTIEYGWENDDFTKNFVINLLQNIPIVSQVVSLSEYGSIPVPTLDAIVKVRNQIVALKASKKPNTIQKNQLKVALSLSRIFGIGGTAQVEQLVNESYKTKKSKLKKVNF